MPISDITAKTYTDGDFLNLLEKRVRKHLRADNRVEPAGSYEIETESLAGALLKYLLERIFKGQVTFSQGQPLATTTMDEYLNRHLEAFLTAGTLPRPEHPAPLIVISNHELITAASIIGLSGRPPAPAHPVIEQLHERYPQTKSSMLKSFLHLDAKLGE